MGELAATPFRPVAAKLKAKLDKIDPRKAGNSVGQSLRKAGLFGKTNPSDGEKS